MLGKEAPISLMGPDILSLVTMGMYDTPLTIYREYIQNAADAIENSPMLDKGRVEISINPGERSIKIRDNGPGLTDDRARRELIPIARSRKRRGIDRGFRGIGRLSGLAFAEKITFRTRSQRTHPITEVSWDGTKLRANVVAGTDPEQTIQRCVDVSRVDGKGSPNHFFEVVVEHVARHAAGQLLNRNTVRKYIGEVGPVPMSQEFPFTKEIERLFTDGGQPLALEITLTGEEEPICRTYGASLKFSEERSDVFTELQALRVPSADGDKDAAVGWVAHSSYFGAIPKNLRIRGIRLREGNIQIGGEDVLDDLFREERFNRWCVGELHIIDERLLPNGRRDYFEPGPHLRHIENHLESIIQGVESRCRNASSARNRVRKTLTALQHIESAYELAISGYLRAGDARDLVREGIRNVGALEVALNPTIPDYDRIIPEIVRLRLKLSQFRTQRENIQMGNIGSSEVGTYQQIFKALVDLSPSPSIAKEMIEKILGRA